MAPRSGLAWKKFIDVGAGVVDYDYRGNVGVILFNHGEEDFVVRKGDRGRSSFSNASSRGRRRVRGFGRHRARDRWVREHGRDDERRIERRRRFGVTRCARP